MRANVERRDVAVVVGYLAFAACWVWGYLKHSATYHEFLFFSIAVAAHLAMGFVSRRFWTAALPLSLLALSAPAGQAGGHPGGDFNSVFDFALLMVPFACVAVAVGAGIARILARRGTDSR